MCSFSIPISLSYSYVTYSASIYPVPKFCTAYSGKIAYFPNVYIIQLHIILSLVGCILTSSTIAATYYIFVEVLKVNPHQEAGEIASCSYFLNKQVYRYCTMVALFSFFPTDEWSILFQPIRCNFHILKKLLGGRSWYCNKMPIL